MDHYLSPSAWDRAGLEYRDAAFLSGPHFSRPGAIADLSLVPRTVYEAMPGTRKSRVLPLGVSDVDARDMLSHLEDTPV